MKRGRSIVRAASSRTSIAIGAPSASVSTASPAAPRSSAWTTRALTSTTLAPAAPGRRLDLLAREVHPVVLQRRVLGLADVAELAVVQQHRPMAEHLHRGHVVRHQDDRPAGAAPLPEDVHALLRERGVPDREDLVDQHDVGVGLDRHGEREADHHPRRVVLELEVDEVLELGELEHLVEAAAGLAQRQAHQDAVEDAVLARGELGVEADAELDERRDAPGRPHPARVGAVDAGQDLQQAALARAVRAPRSRRTRPGGRRRRRRAARGARGTRSGSADARRAP